MAKKMYEKPTCELLLVAMDIVTLSQDDGASFDAEDLWWKSSNVFGGWLQGGTEK